MQIADLPEIHDIESAANQFPWSLKNFQDSLNAGYQGWVMRDLNTIVAFAIVQYVLDEAHILDFCVRPDRQRQGLGKTMLNELINIAEKRGSNLLVLEVRKSNQRAQSLYLSAGFNEIAIRRGYYPAKQGREDAVMMGLVLLGAVENTFVKDN